MDPKLSSGRGVSYLNQIHHNHNRNKNHHIHHHHHQQHQLRHQHLKSTAYHPGAKVILRHLLPSLTIRSHPGAAVCLLRDRILSRTGRSRPRARSRRELLQFLCPNALSLRTPHSISSGATSRIASTSRWLAIIPGDLGGVTSTNT